MIVQNPEKLMLFAVAKVDQSITTAYAHAAYQRSELQ